MAQATFSVGAGYFSYQDKIPLTLNQTIFNASATFSLQAIHFGYEDLLFKNRYRIGMDVSYLRGSLDIHKIEGIDTNRKDLQVYMLSGKYLYRTSATFAFGPMGTFNQSTIKDVGQSQSVGMFLNVEYNLFDKYRLIQSFGTVGASRRFAYAFGVTKFF